MRHFVTLDDVSTAEIETIFALTTDLKDKLRQGVREPLLPGRVLALLFEKPSLRTRVSFESCMAHLGGSSLMLGSDTGFGGPREALVDFARVLSQMVDVVVIRSKRHDTVTEFAKHADCSVVNGLTDISHPCQAMADLYTIRERFGDLKGRKVAWIGDANNVARSLAHGCARLGVEFVIAGPKGYQMDPALLDRFRQQCPGAKLSSTVDAVAAIDGASAVYTDIWASMGQEHEADVRKKAFADYQVNEALFAKAPDDAIFLHCLPAHRGEEVTDGVMDHDRSAVIEQAANRLHVQKGILVWLLGSHAHD
ncbi:Ornithine carbamoyltransferase [Botrimarina colliarenosi]|uniref:Ornithine carbamoyltransferase n=1 Tax=Botrimarina colliarenosi TaxID=2528001 RepID=A0A5C6A748_9BACT|nr:ornithine carbamoyltransferase [Botrimarina colliarenosi]TWT95329.1 Ornithine carbamoyltransferase [Botrimarina colliarenosi]